MGIISWSLLANKYMLLGSAAKSWNLCCLTQLMQPGYQQHQFKNEHQNEQNYIFWEIQTRFRLEIILADAQY